MDRNRLEPFKLLSAYDNRSCRVRNHINIDFLENITSFNMQPEKIKCDFSAELTNWYEKVINHAISMIAQWEYKTNLRHTCKGGCTHCCCQLIEVYNYEVLVIMEYLKRTGQLHMVKEAEALSNYINQKLPGNYIELDADESISYKMKYRTLKIPCLFKKDGKCAIYKIRPSCCATYFSYGPVKDCEDYSSVPAGCINYDFIEEWIVEQILIFLKHNREYVPGSFNLFNLAVLPVGINDYCINQCRKSRGE